jgi:hypothetical protein
VWPESLDLIKCSARNIIRISQIAAKKIYWSDLKNLQTRQHRKGILRVLWPAPPLYATSTTTTTTLFPFHINLSLNDREA